MSNSGTSFQAHAKPMRVINGQLPVLNGISHGPTMRPYFGSPEVAPYGAVGLSGTDDPVSVPDGEIAPAKSRDGTRESYQVNPRVPLALAGGLSHHKVDEDNLWIAVHDGKLIVSDPVEHELMKAYIDGFSPVEAAEKVERGLGLKSGAAWTASVPFLGRLAAAGFIKGIRGYHSVKKIRPHSFARFHLTQRCQLECVHCYTNSGPHLPRDGELPVERWLQLIDEFADNGGEKILFTGGEALVYQGCMALLRRAHEKGLEVTLFSNGILIPRYIEELKEIADKVQISVDGPGPETHDAVRGEGSFVKAIRAIRLLLDAGLETRVSTTIMMNNWPSIQRDMPGFIDQFKDTKVTFRVSYGAMPHGRGTELDHSLDTKEVRRFVDGLLSRINKLSDNAHEGMNVVQKTSGCGYAEQLVVAPDGFVYPCHLLSGALGHVDDLPVREITRYLVRTAEAFSVNHRVGCGTCDLRNLCGGTCRVDDEKHTGSRLITTCTPEEKLRKKRFLVSRYRPS